MSGFNMNEIKKRTELFFENICGVVIDNSYDPYMLNVYKKYVKEHHINYLISQDNDLSYLKFFPQIEFIEINDESENIEYLYTLKELKGIKIHTNILNKLDLNLFSKLEYVYLIINEKFNFNNLLNIKYLYIQFYNEKSILNICHLKQLKKLTLEYGNKIESLKGIENLLQLNSIKIDYCKKLKDISNLIILPNLKELEILQSNQIENIEKVFMKLTNIEKVIIFSKTGSSKKAITSLKFIKNLKHLKVFQTDYIIKDGDLTPLMNLNDTCILTWRKYYNMKDKDLPHESVVYRVDNLRGITKKLTEIENGKENKNIIWFDEL